MAGGESVLLGEALVISIDQSFSVELLLGTSGLYYRRVDDGGSSKLSLAGKGKTMRGRR